MYRPDLNKPDHYVQCIAASDGKPYLAATFRLVKALSDPVPDELAQVLPIDVTKANIMASLAWETGIRAGERVVELRIPQDPMATEAEREIINLCAQLEAMRKSVLVLLESPPAVDYGKSGNSEHGHGPNTFSSAALPRDPVVPLTEWTKPVEKPKPLPEPTVPAPASDSKVVSLTQADCRLVLYSPDFIADRVEMFLQENQVDICATITPPTSIGAVPDSGVVVFVSRNVLKYKLEIQIGEVLAAEFEGYNTDGVFVQSPGGPGVVTISTGTVAVHGSYGLRFQAEVDKLASRVNNIVRLYREISERMSGASAAAPTKIVNPLIASATFQETTVGSWQKLLTPVSIEVPTDNQVMEIEKEKECVMRVFGVEVAFEQHKKFIGALAGSKLTACSIPDPGASLDLSAYAVRVLKHSVGAEVRFAPKRNAGFVISYLVKDGDKIFGSAASVLPKGAQLPSISNSYSKPVFVGPLFELAQFFISVTAKIGGSLTGLSPDTPVTRPVSIDATAIRLSGVLVYTPEFPILGGPRYIVVNSAYETSNHFAMREPPNMDDGTIGWALRLHKVRASVDLTAKDSSEFSPVVAVFKSVNKIQCLADETGSGDLFVRDMLSGAISASVDEGLYRSDNPKWEVLSKTCAHLSRNRANIEIGFKETVPSLVQSTIEYKPPEKVTVQKFYADPAVPGREFKIPEPPIAGGSTGTWSAGGLTLQSFAYALELKNPKYYLLCSRVKRSV